MYDSLDKLINDLQALHKMLNNCWIISVESVANQLKTSLNDVEYLVNNYSDCIGDLSIDGNQDIEARFLKDTIDISQIEKRFNAGPNEDSFPPNKNDSLSFEEKLFLQYLGNVAKEVKKLAEQGDPDPMKTVVGNLGNMMQRDPDQLGMQGKSNHFRQQRYKGRDDSQQQR